MRVVVTGGAGFIGANFLRWIVPREPNTEFINVDKLTYAANLLSLKGIADEPNYSFERVDIADRVAVDELFRRAKPDWIIHFAAESHVDRSILGPLEFVRTNIEGTFHLLEAARHAWAGRSDVLFHHVSTDEVYGSLGATGHFHEDTRYDPSSPYSATKASSDHLVRAFHRTYKLPVKITNCSNNYGPLQFPEKLVPLMILNMVQRKPLPIYGNGENVRDWLYVGDHCEAIWQVATRGPVGETFNVGGWNEKTNLEVIDTLASLVAERLKVPAAELLALKTRVSDRPGHDLRYAIDASKLEKALGWKPRETFETGMAKTVDWYLQNPEWVNAVQSGEYRAWMDANYAQR